MSKVVRSVAVMLVLCAAVLASASGASAQATDPAESGGEEEVEEFLDEFSATEALEPGYESVIISLAPGSPLMDFLSPVEDEGGVVTDTYEYALNGFAATLPSWVVDALEQFPGVITIEPNFTVSIAVQDLPAGIARVGASSNPEIDIIDGVDEQVNVDIGILDTGINTSHPDLNVQSSMTACPTNSNCHPSGEDQNGHGSHVAGTAAARDNGIGVVGIAPGARLHGIQVLGSNGSGTMADVISGVDYATSQAGVLEVINMSLSCICSSSLLDEALDNATEAGIVPVVSAGNDGISVSQVSPADHPRVITVSAVADFDGIPGGLAGSSCGHVDDRFASFSNRGSGVDIAAPGICVNSTVLGSGYSSGYSGTSMAAPHVAGAAALLASMSKPVDATGVANLKNTLLLEGTFDYNENSGDGIKEPLLNVSNPNVFDPVFVGGGGTEPTTPVADFTADDQTIAPGGSVQFTDASTQSPTSWSWTFEGGSPGSSSDENPSVTYNTAGTYDVTLTATNAEGPSAPVTKTGYIVVAEPAAPVAQFLSDTQTITAGQSVNFDDDSSNAPTGWSWTFEGGSPGSSSDENPSVTYNTAGTYDVTLTASNGDGDSPPLTMDDYITVDPAPLSYCAASGSNQNYEYINRVQIGGEGGIDNTSGASGYSDYSNQIAQLEPGSTVNIDLTPGFPGSTYSESWAVGIDYNGDGDFGDSGETVFSDSGNETVSGSFVIPADATGSARIRVGMQWNSTPSLCASINYGEVEDFTAQFVDPPPPTAGFSGTPTSIETGESVDFTDSSTGNPTSLLWTFDGGDPATSTSSTPSVTYNSPGQYTVSLKATNAFGDDTETKTNYITVTDPPPTAEFSGTPTSINIGESVDFTDLSSNTPNGWSWSFPGGNVTSSSAQNPTVTYASPGTYNVSLIASNASGGASTQVTKTNYITVTDPTPSANFTSNTASIETGESVDFTDSSTGNPTSLLWTFDGGNVTSSTSSTPSVTYNSPGQYTVSLKATNAFGDDTETKTNYITVTDPPPVSYCASSGGNQGYEYISRVDIGGAGDIDRSSGAADYTDYSGTDTANLAESETVSVSLTPTFPGSSYTEFWVIWIDYNRDGDFTDAGEEVFSGSSNSVLSGDFTVDGSESGSTRMRVAMQWGSAPSPCGNFTWGEVEDYLVTFS